MAKLIMLVTLTVDKLGILVFRAVAAVAGEGSCKNSKKKRKQKHTCLLEDLESLFFFILQRRSTC